MNSKFVKQIEDMKEEELIERLKEGETYPLPPIKELPYLGELKERITYEYSELVALCPMTGILDLYKVNITFIPDKFIPELKSLRHYFLAYKEVPILHEQLLARIYKDFKKAICPLSLQVRLEVNIRGGIKTVIEYSE